MLDIAKIASPQRRRWLGRALAGALALAGTPLLVRGAAAAPRVIAVNARRFVFTPDRIAVRAGEPVVFELTVQDTFMGFSVPELGIRADLVPGRTVRLPAVVPKAGSYTFLCDVFCGSGHEDMHGLIEVTA